mgnify:CR=1 FL=1
MQRRHFLGAGASLTLAGHPLLAAAQSSSTFAQRRLLVLMLRGGMDGLCAIPPTGDPQLQALRANLVPSPAPVIWPRQADFRRVLASRIAVDTACSPVAISSRMSATMSGSMLRLRCIALTRGRGSLSR